MPRQREREVPKSFAETKFAKDMIEKMSGGQYRAARAAMLEPEPASLEWASNRARFLRETICREPRKAPNLLRELHKKRRMDRRENDVFGFLAVFISPLVGDKGVEPIPAEIWLQLFAAHFDVAIIDIFLDDSFYTGRSELHQLYISMAFYALTESLHIVTNILMRFADRKDDKRIVDATCKRYLQNLEPFTAAMWKHRDDLLLHRLAFTGRNIQESFGSFVGPILGVINHVSKQSLDPYAKTDPREMIATSHLLHLCLWCWHHDTGEMILLMQSSHLAVYWTAIDMWITDRGKFKEDLLNLIQPTILEALGKDAWIACLKRDLEGDKAPTTQMPALKIYNTISDFPESEIWGAMVDARLYRDVLAVVQPAGKASPAMFAELLRLIHIAIGCTINKNIDGQKVLVSDELVLDVVEDPNLVTLIVETLLIFPHPTPCVPQWPNFIPSESCADLLLAYTVARNKLLQASNQGSTDAAERATLLRDRIRPHWYRVLQHLRPLPAVSKALQSWLQFGRDLQFKEDEERRIFQRDTKDGKRNCDWRGCEFYVRMPEKSLKGCKGCNRAYYCGAACQKRDWKDGGHKKMCRTVKD
ncbi:hypothetical protein PENSPDRAFT_680400 [Peniophora sp. CONT]|nr:hypothetical protein PENSPDRAFT_680400 [Peniophora sp. CONT]